MEYQKSPLEFQGIPFDQNIIPWCLKDTNKNINNGKTILSFSDWGNNLKNTVYIAQRFIYSLFL